MSRWEAVGLKVLLLLNEMFSLFHGGFDDLLLKLLLWFGWKSFIVEHCDLVNSVLEFKECKLSLILRYVILACGEWLLNVLLDSDHRTCKAR